MYSKLITHQNKFHSGVFWELFDNISHFRMWIGVCLALVNLITTGTATITEAQYTLSVNYRYEGPILGQLQDIPEMFCAASCREHADCVGFHAGADNSCQLFGRGYLIDDISGDKYYVSNEPSCKYKSTITSLLIKIIHYYLLIVSCTPQ
jgi:hypothetical protein